MSERWKGCWSATATYAAGNRVKLAGVVYQAVDASTNSQPPSAHWVVVPQPTNPLDFAKQMVIQLQLVLSENVGHTEVNVDGTDVKYADLEKKLAYWQRQMNRLNGMAPTVSRIRLDRF
jgi:hypothetical protein